MLNITVTWHGCPYNIVYNKAIKSFVVANYNFFEMSDLSIVIYFKTLRIAIAIKSIILEDTYVISINPNQIRSP